MKANVKHKVPRSLICNEAYEVGFTKHNRPYFNARPSDPHGLDPALTPVNPAENFDWVCASTLIPIPLSWLPQFPVALADPLRNLLIIQNNSVGNTAGGDVLPVLSVSLDGPINAAGVTQVPTVLNFPPGFGIVLDVRVPANSIYVAWGTFTKATGAFNAGATVVLGRTLNRLPPR